MTKLDISHRFFGPRLKVERANHHITELEKIVRAYVFANVKALNPKRNRHAGKDAARIGGRIPFHVPTIVGDAIHNLRTSLDHAYVVLVEANSGTVDRHTKFPFGDTRKNTVSSVNGQKNRPADATLNFIFDVIKPFEDEGSELYGVHRLDIADKHHLLISTEAAMAIERLDILARDGRPTGGGFTNMTLVGTYGQQGALVDVGEFGAKLYGDPHTTFDIRFAQGQPFEDESVLHTLKRLEVLTRATVEDLAKFV